MALCVGGLLRGRRLRPSLWLFILIRCRGCYARQRNVSSTTFLYNCIYQNWSPPLQQSSTFSKNTHIPPYSAFVIRFPSPQTRDFFIRTSNKLKSHTANTIFGEGGNNAVFINALWPKPVHKLFTSAPTVRKKIITPDNLVVCLRETYTSPLIPIFTESQLLSHFSQPDTSPSSSESELPFHTPHTSHAIMPFSHHPQVSPTRPLLTVLPLLLPVLYQALR